MKQRAILFFFIGIMTGILQAQTLTLKDAGQLFLKQNLSLIAARYDMDIAQAQVLQARLFENPVISLEQNVYNRLNGKYFDMGKDGETRYLMSLSGKIRFVLSVNPQDRWFREADDRVKRLLRYM